MIVSHKIQNYSILKTIKCTVTIFSWRNNENRTACGEWGKNISSALL